MNVADHLCIFLYIVPTCCLLARQTIQVVDNAPGIRREQKHSSIFLSDMAVDLTKSPVWVSRMGAYFDSVDVDKSGTVDIDEFLQWAENMRDLCKATDAEMKNLREQLKKSGELRV